MKTCHFHTPNQRVQACDASQRAVFLDKDGTLIDNVPYNIDPTLIRLAPNAAAGLRMLYEQGYVIIVISNQSGVARGYFLESDLHAVEQRLAQLCTAAGAQLADLYYCPHHPHGSVPAYARACWGQKPSPGLILKAAQDYNIALSESWFIGDILDDVEAGRRAGCRTVLLSNGHETEWQMSPLRTPHAVAPDLQAAAALILAAPRRGYGEDSHLVPSREHSVRSA